MAEPAWGSLPFAEQIAFFRGKVNVPTARWDDIWQAAHDRAFMVAGAAKADLLQDLREALDKAISQGATLAEFREDFEALVARRGWTGWTGEGSEAGRAWRTRVIYATNLRTSYAAGRYQQLQAIKHRRPYWRYVHNDTVVHPRKEHLAWDGLVLPADDPWWATHYPPSGFGCRCRVESVAEADLEGLGKPGPDTAPTPPDDTAGVDPGWAYAPGANAAKPLRELLDRKLFNLDAPIGAAMAEALAPRVAAERQADYEQWLAAVRAGDQRAKARTPVVGALHPEDVAWLRRHRPDAAPRSAEIAMRSGLIDGPKAARHAAKGDAIAEHLWDALPQLLEAPLAVLLDNDSGNLLYVLPEPSARRPQLAVELDYRRRGETMNMLVSGYRPPVQNLLERIRAGGVRVVRGALDAEQGG